MRVGKLRCCEVKGTTTALCKKLLAAVGETIKHGRAF
jgi:hypothetical protein